MLLSVLPLDFDALPCVRPLKVAKHGTDMLTALSPTGVLGQHGSTQIS